MTIQFLPKTYRIIFFLEILSLIYLLKNNNVRSFEILRRQFRSNFRTYRLILDLNNYELIHYFFFFGNERFFMG